MGKYKPPHKWTAAQLALLGKVPDKVLAAKLGLHKITITVKRLSLGIRITRSVAKRRHSRLNWGITEIGMLGRYPDEEVAQITARRVEVITKKREELGIRPFRA